MAICYFYFCCLLITCVISKPLDNSENHTASSIKTHKLHKRSSDIGIIDGDAIYLENLEKPHRKIRSIAEDCEKLQLCKLHARAPASFLDSFQLYFVNRENAKLWDHRQHTRADCERLFASCYENQPPRYDLQRRRQQQSIEDYY